ncbi:MAG: hypothetical protein AB7O04_03595 [Hyphomonadaceae bacterium]
MTARTRLDLDIVRDLSLLALFLALAAGTLALLLETHWSFEAEASAGAIVGALSGAIGASDGLLSRARNTLAGLTIGACLGLALGAVLRLVFAIGGG